MPSILNNSGFPRTARPNVYTKVDASALAGGDASSGNLAIIGDFPLFPSLTPKQFFSRRSTAAYDLSDSDLALLAQLAFSPSDDPAANLGASSFTVVNAREDGTRSTVVHGPLTLTSTIYGTKANRLVSDLTINGDEHKLSLSRNGLSEQYTISNDVLATIENNTGSPITVEIEAGTVTVTSGVNTLLTFDSSEAADLRAALLLINNLADIEATLIEPLSIPLESIDYINLAIAVAATSSIKAPAYLLLSALSNSALVTAEIDNLSSAASLIAGRINATGGTNAGSLNYTDALASIENKDIQIVVLFTEDSSSQSLLAAHLSASANAGYERQAYCAIAQTSSLAVIRTRASSLNNAGIALVGQGVTLINPQAQRVKVGAKYTALLLAAMQAGSDIGQPLTRKRPRIIETNQTWDTYADAEEALRSGLLFISEDNLGPRVERGITTYLTDNNPVYSEISSYESVLASLRDLRTALADLIGQPTKQSQLALISGRVNTRLTAQVKDGIIKRFQNIQLEDLGDQVAVSYEVAPVEPLNFVTLTAIAQRITA